MSTQFGEKSFRKVWVNIDDESYIGGSEEIGRTREGIDAFDDI